MKRRAVVVREARVTSRVKMASGIGMVVFGCVVETTEMLPEGQLCEIRTKGILGRIGEICEDEDDCETDYWTEH